MPTIGPELPPHFLNRSTTRNDAEDADDSGDDGPQPARAPVAPSVASIGPQIGPQRPPNAGNNAEDEDDEQEDAFGPQLPSSLTSSRRIPDASTRVSAQAGPSQRPVGPTMPPSHSQDREKDVDDDDSDEDIGPMPLPAGMSSSQPEDGVREFLELEERRRKQAEEAAKPKKLKRDEWMLVPPSSSDLLGGLDPTKLKPRQFSRSTAPAKTKSTDSTLWTETPAERQQRLADEVMGRKKRASNAEEGEGDEEERAEMRKRMKRDEEIRRGVEEHTKKVRGSTLVDKHAAKTKASADANKEPDAIWDHSRDMGLGGRLMDDRQRDKMLADAKGLGSRFGTGKSGGFL